MLLLLHALHACVAAYILPYFLALSSYILQHFNGNVLYLFHWFFVVYLLAMLFTRVCKPHPFCCSSNVPKEERWRETRSDRHRNWPKNEVRQLSHYKAVTQPETEVTNTVLYITLKQLHLFGTWANKKWRPKLALLGLQTLSLAALGEGVKILCIKDHVHSSINDFCERNKAINNPSFMVYRSFELKKKEENDDEQSAFFQFSDNHCSCIFYVVWEYYSLQKHLQSMLCVWKGLKHLHLGVLSRYFS